MRFKLLVLILFITTYSFGQNNKLIKNKIYFEKELSAWKKTFSKFNISNFIISDTLSFENNNEQDFENYKQFIKVYKPIITYSSDSAKFIDIYSYQLNLEKKLDYYQTNIEIDQGIFLFDKNKNYWKRIYFSGTSDGWIEEVVWVSKNEFFLLGIEKNDKEKRLPVIILGNLDSKKLVIYKTKINNCFQTIRYESAKLKKMKIKGL